MVKTNIFVFVKKYLASWFFFIPLQSQNKEVLLCNGSTTDFGSVSLGSNPGRTTEKMVKNFSPSFFYKNS